MKDQQGGNQESMSKSLLQPLERSLDGLTTFPFATVETLASVLDCSPDALLLVDRTGTIRWFNKQLADLFGYTQEELEGQLLEVLLPERQRAFHEIWRQRSLHDPRTRPMGVGLDLIGRHKDGSEFPIDVSLRPLLVGQTLCIVSAVRRMVPQRSREQERRQLTERLRLQSQLINLSSDAILVCSPEGHILSWNAGAEELYGWKEQDVIGQISTDLLATHFPLPFEELFQVLVQKGRWDGDLIHRCRDGRDVIVESRWALVRDERGKPTAILEINRDVTERRRLEHREQDAQEEMRARLDVLQLILDRLATGIFLVQGLQGRLLLANHAAIDLWGVEWSRNQSKEDFLAQSPVSFLTEDGQPLLPEHSLISHAMLTGEPVLHRQLVIRRPDGGSLPVIVDAIPLDLFQALPRLPVEM
ncbi:MAG TPA: PAS domain-containing protein, partial [Ktedonobacteraceae bacterium]|nr:PAS domain-containing protein [Ktedonobacteraceae bacterium]